MTGIKIRKLNIRLRGISQDSASSLISGLPEEIGRQVAINMNMIKDRREMTINKIDSGSIEINKDSSFSDIRSMIARKIVKSISEEIK